MTKVDSTETLMFRLTQKLKHLRLLWCATTSVQEPNQNDKELFIYPNPVKDIVTIEMKGIKNLEYYLYSIIGVLVQSGTIDSDNNTINIANLRANLYLLKMGTSTSKLIIVK